MTLHKVIPGCCEIDRNGPFRFDRNFSKLISINFVSIPSKFRSISIVFHFEIDTEISSTIEIFRKNFGKFRSLGQRSKLIEINFGKFRSLGQRSKLIEIYFEKFRSQNNRNFSKFFGKISKWSISFRISFRFVSKKHRNETLTEVSQHPG